MTDGVGSVLYKERLNRWGISFSCFSQSHQQWRFIQAAAPSTPRIQCHQNCFSMKVYPLWNRQRFGLRFVLSFLIPRLCLNVWMSRLSFNCFFHSHLVLSHKRKVHCEHLVWVEWSTETPFYGTILPSRSYFYDFILSNIFHFRNSFLLKRRKGPCLCSLSFLNVFLKHEGI